MKYYLVGYLLAISDFSFLKSNYNRFIFNRVQFVIGVFQISYLLKYITISAPVTFWYICLRKGKNTTELFLNN